MKLQLIFSVGAVASLLLAGCAAQVEPDATSAAPTSEATAERPAQPQRGATQTEQAGALQGENGGTAGEEKPAHKEAIDGCGSLQKACTFAGGGFCDIYSASNCP